MPDHTTSDPRAAAVDALIAAGATDEEITSILKEKFGGWRPGADSLVGNRLRGVRTISDTPEKEPDTYWGGFFRSLRNEFSPSAVRDNLIKSPAMQGAARPETAGDIANLLIPSGIEGAMNAAGTLKRSLKGAIAPGSKVKDWPRQLAGRVHDRWTDPLDLGERAMRDAPLHQQMNILDGPPVRAEAVRTGTPPYQPSPTPFHEKPLYQQMSDLPETPAPILGRTAGPPHRPQVEPVPFHEQPLHQQMADLPQTPAPELGAPTPPVRQEPVPFHERPLYQQMDALPQTEAPVIGRGADAPYQPTPPSASQARPTGPPPILRKAAQTPDEILIEKLQEGLTPEGPTTVSAAPEPTATATGRPSVQPSQYDAIVESAEGRPRASEPYVSVAEREAAATEAAAPPAAEPMTTPEPAGEPSPVGQQLRDSLVEEARKKRQQATVNDILDYHGRNNMPGVSRKQAAQVDARMAPHGLSGEAAERIAGKVSEGLTSPEARQSLIEYYNSARDDLFKNRLGQAMRDAGILPSE